MMMATTSSTSVPMPRTNVLPPPVECSIVKGSRMVSLPPPAGYNNDVSAPTVPHEQARAVADGKTDRRPGEHVPGPRELRRPPDRQHRYCRQGHPGDHSSRVGA